MAVLCQTTTLKSFRLKNRCFWGKLLSTHPVTWFFNVAAFLSISWYWINCFTNLELSAAQLLSEAWLLEGNAGAGGISGAVVSLKWARRHSCLFVPCRLGFRPKQLKRVMLRNVLRDPWKNHRMMSCDGLPGLRCCPWPTSCVQTHCGRMLELRVKKNFFPWGRKSRSPLLLLPNYGYKIHIHSLSEFRKHSFFSCFTLDKGYELSAASAWPVFVSV